MKLSGKDTVQNIASLLGCEFIGNPDQIVQGINEIHKVENGHSTS